MIVAASKPSASGSALCGLHWDDVAEEMIGVSSGEAHQIAPYLDFLYGLAEKFNTVSK